MAVATCHQPSSLTTNTTRNAAITTISTTANYSFTPSVAAAAAHFLTTIPKFTIIPNNRITKSPSDSGASSADPDETQRDGSIENFSCKNEKLLSTRSDTSIIESYRNTVAHHLSPYTMSNGRLPSTFLAKLPHDIGAVRTILTTARFPDHNDHHILVQNEPIDLSFKTIKKRRRLPTPLLSTSSLNSSTSSPPSIIDQPKPAPLDLSLVRSNPLSG